MESLQHRESHHHTPWSFRLSRDPRLWQTIASTSHHPMQLSGPRGPDDRHCTRPLEGQGATARVPGSHSWILEASAGRISSPRGPGKFGGEFHRLPQRHVKTCCETWLLTPLQSSQCGKHILGKKSCVLAWPAAAAAHFISHMSGDVWSAFYRGNS